MPSEALKAATFTLRTTMPSEAFKAAPFTMPSEFAVEAAPFLPTDVPQVSCLSFFFDNPEVARRRDFFRKPLAANLLSPVDIHIKTCSLIDPTLGGVHSSRLDTRVDAFLSAQLDTF